MRRDGAPSTPSAASSRSNFSEELPALKTSSRMKLGPPGGRKEPACAQHDQRRSCGYGEGPQAQARQFGDRQGQPYTGHADRQSVLRDARGGVTDLPPQRAGNRARGDGGITQV